MSTVNQKYLKDEDGNIISPITSMESCYNSKGESAYDKFFDIEGRLGDSSWSEFDLCDYSTLENEGTSYVTKLNSSSYVVGSSTGYGIYYRLMDDGNVLWIKGAVSVINPDSNSIIIMVDQTEYVPKYRQTFTCQVQGNYIARGYIQGSYNYENMTETDYAGNKLKGGYIVLEWVRSLSDGSIYGTRAWLAFECFCLLNL